MEVDRNNLAARFCAIDALEDELLRMLTPKEEPPVDAGYAHSGVPLEGLGDFSDTGYMLGVGYADDGSFKVKTSGSNPKREQEIVDEWRSFVEASHESGDDVTSGASTIIDL